MNEQELHEVVVAAMTAVAPDVDPATIDPSAELAEQLDIDSMDFLNVVVAIHERTGIEIPERDYPKLSTLNDAVAYLADTAAARRPAPDVSALSQLLERAASRAASPGRGGRRGGDSLRGGRPLR